MTRVALVEDDARYRQSLEVLFRHAAGFSLAGSFSSAGAALARLEREKLADGACPWDLALMDLGLPGLGGIEATRRLKAFQFSPAVVIVTVFEDPSTILEAICAGADGYLLKRAGTTELLEQLRAIMAGGAPLTAAVARTVLALLRTSTVIPAAAPRPGRVADLHLTDRERDVLQCLVRGLAYKQVGDSLGISIDTVRTHIRGVYRKLQVHSVAEAVSRALRDGLV